MQKLVMAIAVIIGMFYALTVQAIGPERDTPTAILTLQQITTPSSPTSGFNRIYSKGDDKLYTLNSAGEEIELGAGGAGSGRLNLLEDPSFEDGVTEGSCSGCTASEELTEVLATVNNVKSLEMTYSAATGCYTVTKTTSAQYSPTQMAGSCFIKTSAADVTFEAMVNGVSVLSKEVSSSDSWKEYTHVFVGGATSVGYRVCANSSITDSIFVDECFLGAKDVLSKVGYDTGWEDCGLTTSDFAGFGTVSSIEDFCRRDGQNLIGSIKFTTGTTSATEARLNLKIGGSSFSSADSNIIPSIKDFGSFVENSVGGSSVVGSQGVALIDSAGASYLTFGTRSGSFAPLVARQGSALFTSSTDYTVNFSVPIAGWSATFDSISDVGSVNSENEFSARIANNGTATIVSQSSDFITSVSRDSLGVVTVTFDSGIFSVTPSITANLVSGNVAATFMNIVSPSTTSVEVRSSDNAGTFEDKDFVIKVSRQGTDRKTPQINAILKDVPRTPNSSTGNVDVFSFSFGDTASTQCTSSPCAYLDQIGDIVSSITRTGTGSYTINTSKTYIKLKCVLNTNANTDYTGKNQAINCANTAACGFQAVNVANADRDSQGTAICHGEY